MVLPELMQLHPESLSTYSSAIDAGLMDPGDVSLVRNLTTDQSFELNVGDQKLTIKRLPDKKPGDARYEVDGKLADNLDQALNAAVRIAAEKKSLSSAEPAIVASKD
jgi:hypothetical protein